jgi:hypothetical protein
MIKQKTLTFPVMGLVRAFFILSRFSQSIFQNRFCQAHRAFLSVFSTASLQFNSCQRMNRSFYPSWHPATGTDHEFAVRTAEETGPFYSPAHHSKPKGKGRWIMKT